MKLLAVAGATVLLLCATVARADAQEIASSFEQLSVLVKPGDKISVFDTAGRKFDGRIDVLSRDKLFLSTGAGLRELSEADISEIRQRRGDSLLNGAIIGAVGGTVYFVTMATLLVDADGGDVIVPAAIAGGVICAGIGAAAGAGIDALITRRQPIYRKGATQPRVSVAPLVGRGRRGAAVMFRF